MSDQDKQADEAPKRQRANIAPDAVMDPNEKTDGHPGKGSENGTSKDEEADPGSG